MRTLLAHQGKSQTELAAFLGMDGGSLSRGMKGTRKWTFAEVGALAAFFGTSPATFFKVPELLVALVTEQEPAELVAA